MSTRQDLETLFLSLNLTDGENPEDAAFIGLCVRVLIDIFPRQIRIHPKLSVKIREIESTWDRQHLILWVPL